MYTGDQFSYQICMLYQPNGDNYSDNPSNTYTLASVPNKGYLVFWKVKNGCHPHIKEFPGAIQVNYPNSNLGFDLNDAEAKWMPLTRETQRKISK